jgi:hypothetical protein
MPPDDVEMGVVLHRLDAIDKTLGRITDSLDRLVRVEERQAQTNSAVERSFKAIEALEKRVVPLEQAATLNNRTSVWVERALLAAAGAVGMALLKLVMA